MTPMVRWLTISGVCCALAACGSLGGTFSIDRFLKMEISGDTFGACAARSYQAWARHKAWVQVNYAGAVRRAERAGAAKLNPPSVQTFDCQADIGGSLTRRQKLLEIALSDPSKECACANASVELERMNCAGPADDSQALRRRFETAASACEGRSTAGS